ncbi:hypothetical protein HQ585_01045 [candidate division KSB1 bacterium]|nr:hypothetical protein [candidate division KSB1 bacterium]
MITMHFDYRDLFRSNRLAFSFQRLWIQCIGLLIGYVIYVKLFYLSILVSGGELGMAWERYGLIPSYGAVNFPWFSWVLVGLGVFILVIAWLITGTAVSRATYMNMKGNTFYSWKEAFRFALKKKGLAVIATPVAIAAIAFFTGLGGVVVGLLARIPYVGPIGLSLFTVVWFIVSFFLVFILFALGISLLLTPAVLATTDDDAFEGIFQSFSVLYSQPWRLVLYEALSVILALIGLIVFACVAKLTWRVMTGIFLIGMGGDYGDLSYQAVYLFQSWIYPVIIWIKSIAGDSVLMLFFTHNFISVQLPNVLSIAALIMGVLITLISAFVLAYPIASLNVGHTLVFLILKKMKDDENLLERKDKEEEDEEIEEEDTAVESKDVGEGKEETEK